MSSPARNIIVISVDRIGAAWLGPYGGTHSHTNALNQFAAESLLCEFVLADSWKLESAVRGFWQGLPSYSNAQTNWPALARLATEKGLKSLLLSDELSLLDHPLAAGFEEQMLFDPGDALRTAKSTEATRIGRLFQMAASKIDEPSDGLLFWIHAGAMNHIWDAPYSMREELVAENEPAPPDFVVPPSKLLAANHDPDERLGIVTAYAAQVAAIDIVLGKFIAKVNERFSRDDTMIVFLSPRGLAMGEHLAIGTAGDSLRGEVLQVPCIVRFPRGEHQLIRLGGIFGASDVYSTIAAALGAETSGWGHDLASLAAERLAPPQWSLAREETETALRTYNWFYRTSNGDDAVKEELYAKPDDRFEGNEIAARAANSVEHCREMVEQLTTQLDSLARPKIDLGPDLVH